VLPDWVVAPVSPRPARGRLTSRFLARTLRESSRLVQDAVFAERAARQPGFLQRLDARAKLLSVLGLLVAASFLHHLPSLWLLAAFVGLVATFSRVGGRVLFHRVWWFLPATFVIVVLPAALSVFTPGDPLATVYRTPGPIAFGPIRLPEELTITRQGAAAAALVITRLFVGVLLAVTLTLTTRSQELLRAVHTQATAPFVFILAIMHRYLFVLLRMTDNMHIAKLARTISPAPRAEERRWVGSRVAVLFARSRRLSEQVYAAMLARSYRGDPKAYVTARFGVAEGSWVALCAALIVLMLFLDRVVLGALPW